MDERNERSGLALENEIDNANLGFGSNVDNTMPTQDQIRAQVRTTEALRAGRRDGTAWYVAHMIEDGYAYRQMGADSDSLWYWARPSDFERDCEVLQIVDSGAQALTYGVAIREIARWRQRAEKALSCMGRRSLKRLVDMDGGMLLTISLPRQQKGRKNKGR